MSERPPIITIHPGDRDPIWEEYSRRSEIRSNYLVPLYVMWSSNVPQDAASAGTQGVVDAMSATGQNRGIAVLGSETFLPGDFSNADWYIQKAYDRQELRRNAGHGPQLDIGQFGRLFTEEPWQVEPHWEVLIVNNDLNSRVDGNFINYVFGSTDRSFPYSVQSVRRIIDGERDLPLRNAMIRNLLRHEVGHMFGLVGRSGAVESLGSHCPNVCSLKQTLDLGALRDNTITLERKGVMFCNDCLTELARSRDYSRPLSELPQRLRGSV